MAVLNKGHFVKWIIKDEYRRLDLACSEDQLYLFAVLDDKFWELFNKWIKEGRPKELQPVFKVVDDSKKADDKNLATITKGEL